MVFACRRQTHSEIHGIADAAKAISRQVGFSPAYLRQKKDDTVLEQLVQEVASPRTHAILKSYQERSKVFVPCTSFSF